MRFDFLNQSTAINFETYVALHKKEQKQQVIEPKNEFILDKIETEDPNLLGARYYTFV